MTTPTRDRDTVLSRILTQQDGRELYVEAGDDAGEYLQRVVAADPWSVLLHRELISQAEADAASRHEAVWHETRLVAEGNTNLGGWSGGGGHDPASRMGERATEAWRKWRDGQESMPAQCRGQVYHLIVCYRYPADEHEISVVRKGLRRLAKFYGV